jgi:chromosome partitioning protein
MKVDSLFGKGPTVLNKLRQGLDSLDAVGERTSLVDCCPYIGVLSLSAIFAAETVLIPVSTDYLSLQGAQQITRALKALEPVVKRRVPRRYVLTRYDRRRKMSADIQNRMREEFGVELCQTLIGENVAVAMSPALGKDVFAYQSDSNGARDYQQLFEELHAGGVL